MKIALIGPAYPYRGGIAHHTNMLATYLRKGGHSVDVITFKRQYPAFLYPGAFQEESGGEFAETIQPERLIDSMNPLNWIRVGRMLRKRNYDLCVFRFWIPLFGPVFGVIARVAKKAGAKVLVILDNLIPHEKRPGDAAFTRFMFRQCDMAIAQSGTVHDQFMKHFPAIPLRMFPHPVYEHFGERLPKEIARKQLGITAQHVLLFFGFIRQYKGLDSLIAAMPEIVRRIPDIQLLVVGEFFGDPEPYKKLIRESGVEAHIRLHNEYVPNDEVAPWFSAADMLVLPYHSATNSGIVQIGYNFATPAIVTDVGSLSEVVINGITGYVVQDALPTTLASAVEQMYGEERLKHFAANIAVERKKYSWETFAQGLITFTCSNSRQ